MKEVKCFLFFLARFAYTAPEVLLHSSIQIFSRSFRLQGHPRATGSFRSLQRSSIGAQLWSLARPLQDLEMLVMLWNYSSSPGRHHPSPLLFLREGGCSQNLLIHSCTHPLSPQCGKVILSPLQKSTPKASHFAPTLHSQDGVLGIVLILLLPYFSHCTFLLFFFLIADSFSCLKTDADFMKWLFPRNVLFLPAGIIFFSNITISWGVWCHSINTVVKRVKATATLCGDKGLVQYKLSLQ